MFSKLYENNIHERSNSMSNFIFENTWEENQEALKTKNWRLFQLEVPSSMVLHFQLAQTG